MRRCSQSILYSKNRQAHAYLDLCKESAHFQANPLRSTTRTCSQNILYGKTQQPHRCVGLYWEVRIFKQPRRQIRQANGPRTFCMQQFWNMRAKCSLFKVDCWSHNYFLKGRTRVLSNFRSCTFCESWLLFDYVRQVNFKTGLHLESSFFQAMLMIVSEKCWFSSIT